MEVDDIKQLNKWLLIFGRRKTGKTFLVENFLNYDEYFFVKRDRSILSKKDRKEITYDTFATLIERELSNGKTIAIDEFHRLDEGFFDFIHYTKKHGKLILLSSTLYLSKKLFLSKSPLLGFFSEVPISIINLKDTLNHLKNYNLDKRQLLEMAILLREPLTIDYFEEKVDPRKLIAKIIMHSVQTVPALIGEIFIEEERKISSVYEGVLRAIANGKTVSGEISSYLFSRRLLKKDDPSLIQQYLKNLMEFGIIKRIKVYNKNKLVYKHVSPLSKIYYYADEKYNISERKPSEKELQRIIDELMPMIVEDNIRALISEKYGLEESLFEAKDFDVDGCLLKFKKPEIALEVKWSEKINIEEIENNLKKIKAKKKLLFIPDKKKIKIKDASIEIIDIHNLI
ncbi:MAG: AAA family ATPase [Candidatus Thermoplasmatota archaeon]|nr:AAA family ATPase [Candidatus Thermoplasmatota archaeon]